MRVPLSFTAPQLQRVMARAEELPRPLRHSFLLRVAAKLQLNGCGVVADQRLTRVIDQVLRELRVAG